MRTGHFIAALAAPAALLFFSTTASAAEGEGIGGFYLGAHGGYGTGSTKWDGTANPIPTPPLTNANTADHSADGFLFGGTIGGRWQSGYVVLGVEAEGSWIDSGDTSPSTAFVGLSNSTQTDWLATVTANAGIQTGRVHGYLEVGVVFAGDQYSVADTNGVAPDQNDSISDTRNGVVFGAGLEYLLDGGFSIRGEYNYMNFGANEYALGGDTWRIDPTRSTFRLAVLYRFGGN